MRAVTIALDAMGGDRAPAEICAGALDAVVPGQIEIVLVGDTPLILAEYGGKLPRGITIRHAPEQIAFDEEPLAAVRTKPESSLVVTAGSVREGWAQAAVSAGSTGALLAASTFAMRRIPGVHRPGLAAVIPAIGGPLTLIDCGANVDRGRRCSCSSPTWARASPRTCSGAGRRASACSRSARSPARATS